MPHAALCVSRPNADWIAKLDLNGFNAARSIVCVETTSTLKSCSYRKVSMPHAALCVSRQEEIYRLEEIIESFNAARSIVCVETVVVAVHAGEFHAFQCRTQHCVCRDMMRCIPSAICSMFQCRTQHCVCRDPRYYGYRTGSLAFQCRTQHCVCRD